MRENRTYGSEGGVSRWLIPTPIAIKRLHPWNINGGRRCAFPPYRTRPEVVEAHQMCYFVTLDL